MIDCTLLKNRILDATRSLLKDLPKKPKLVCVKMNNDQASHSYASALRMLCRAMVVDFELMEIRPKNLILQIAIHEANRDPAVTGIIVLRNTNDNSILPLFIMAKQAIEPWKDVEGNEFDDDPERVSCTARACLEIIRQETEIEGKEVVIVGYGKVVGKPLAYLLMRAHAGSVTTTHKYTQNLDEHLKRADIVISAVGKPHFIDYECKDGTVIIDAGISIGVGGVNGDVHPIMYNKAKISPVPGGVGPVTSALVMQNVALAANGKFWSPS